MLWDFPQLHGKIFRADDRRRVIFRIRQDDVPHHAAGERLCYVKRRKISFADAGTGETVEVDGITGATVTSKAVAKSVNSAVAYVTGADVASSATTWGG